MIIDKMICHYFTLPFGIVFNFHLQYTNLNSFAPEFCLANICAGC